MDAVREKFRISAEKLKSFCERNGIRELALFGSALGKDFDEAGDIDLLVEFKPEASVGFMELSRMHRELSAMLGGTVDLVSKNGLKPKIRDSIISSAEVLYAA